eukprot:s1947_g6.t1
MHIGLSAKAPDTLKGILHSNRAYARLQLEQWSSAEGDCSEALFLNSKNPKALYRRALARKELKKFQAALDDVKQLLPMLEPPQKQNAQKLKDELESKLAAAAAAPAMNGKNHAEETLHQSQRALRSRSRRALRGRQQEETAPVAKPKEETRPVTETQKAPAEPFADIQLEHSLAGAEKAKETGNKLFQEGKIEDSERWFSKAIWLVEESGKVNAPDTLKGILHSNRAYARLQLEQWSSAEGDCSEALKLNSKNPKALFRRALARKGLKQFQGALEDVKHLLPLLVGDPGPHVRLLAALPRAALVQGAVQGSSLDGGGFSATQAAQVGLVWRTSRKLVHIWAGLPEEEFKDVDPWEPSGGQAEVAERTRTTGGEGETQTSTPNQLKERVLKMSALVDQMDESELPPARRDGSYILRELPGPQNWQQWLSSWRVYKNACLMLGVTSLAALQVYEKHIERLTMMWPRCWGLIYQAEDKARAEHISKIRRKLVVDFKKGLTMPEDWDEANPWTSCFRLLVADAEYWNEQVRHPAASWTASGSRGVPLAPADQIAAAHMPGGNEVADFEKEEKGDPRKRQSNRDRRLARAKRLRAEKEELDAFRKKSTGGDGRGSDKGKGKGKGIGRRPARAPDKLQLEIGTNGGQAEEGAKDVLAEAILRLAKLDGMNVEVTAEVIQSQRLRKVPECGTLENPPGSEGQGEGPAWKLPEIMAFLDNFACQVAVFNTCAFQSKERTKWFKPGQLGGRLEGLTSLSRKCTCPKYFKHESLVGKELTSRAAQYPSQLALEIARLVIKAFRATLNLEWWRHQEAKTRGKLQEAKSQWVASKEKSKTGRLVMEDKMKELRGCKRAWDAGDVERDQVPTPAKKSKKEIRDEENSSALGGMRNPGMALRRMAILKEAGSDIARVWNNMVTDMPEALEAARAYGSDRCQLDGRVLKEFEDRLRAMMKVPKEPEVKLKGRLQFESPLKAEWWEAWQRFSKDPETDLVQWIRRGAPLGMGAEIPKSNGIYPAVPETEVTTEMASLESQVSTVNYQSVKDNQEAASAELQRLIDKGFAKLLPVEEAKKLFGDGTVSRLALISKMKDSGVMKHRLVIDLLRSGGNGLARVPE